MGARPVHLPSKRQKYNFLHSVDLSKNLIVPKSDYQMTIAVEIGRTRIVVSARFYMLPAVQLYHQTALKTHEINNVHPDRSLTPKAVSTQLPETEVRPKSLLGVGGVFPESPGPRYFKAAWFHLGFQCKESQQDNKN